VLAQADGGDGGGVPRSEGGGGGMEAEVLVKVAALLHLSRIHMHNQKFKDADKAAAEKSICTFSTSKASKLSALLAAGGV